MRLPLALLVSLLFAACDLRDSRNGRSVLTSSTGEVALADGGRLEFSITSQQYKRWDRARRGINRRVAARFGEILQPDAPTERSIAEAVAYLESEPNARRAIENAGISVRGFVVMTVALEQELRLASGQPAVRPPQPAPYEFPQYDTALIKPSPTPYPADEAPYPAPVDTYRIDTSFPSRPVDTAIRVVVPVPRRDTVRPTPTIFRRDTLRRDTSVAPRRDSMVGPAAPPPAPPDTGSPP